MIVLMISGKQGAGKTSTSKKLADYLLGQGISVISFKFADVLYALHDAVWATLTQYGIEKTQPVDGSLLQILGTEYGRAHLGEDVWVNCLKNRILETERNIRTTMLSMDQNPDGFERVYLVDDLRFKNEFDRAFSDAIRVRLEAPEEVRKGRAEKWRDKTSHPSETDLDGYVLEGRFDLVLNTNEMSADEVVESIAQLVADRIKENSCTNTLESSASLIQPHQSN